jgi:2-keto-myo-inositol isomerase
VAYRRPALESGIFDERIVGFRIDTMKPCISQATTLKNPFEADPAVFSRNGWTDIEIWLTKLETFLKNHSLAEARTALASDGIRAVAASCQGGLLLSRGGERESHWKHFEQRLAILAELGVPVLIVTPDFVAQASSQDYLHAASALGEASEMAATFGVRLALEFQKTSTFCACLETAIALIEQSGAQSAGVCLDFFHFYTGPSKMDDLARLTPQNLAWVQVSDLIGTPRELAGDSDRILPGEGDFPLGPIIEQLGRIGYDGHASLEVLNPHLWQVDPDRLADLGRQALLRVLGPWATSPTESKGGSQACQRS